MTAAASVPGVSLPPGSVAPLGTDGGAARSRLVIIEQSIWSGVLAAAVPVTLPVDHLGGLPGSAGGGRAGYRLQSQCPERPS